MWVELYRKGDRIGLCNSITKGPTIFGKKKGKKAIKPFE